MARPGQARDWPVNAVTQVKDQDGVQSTGKVLHPVCVHFAEVLWQLEC